MKALEVMCVAGCRPNFVKLAPLLEEMGRRPEIRPTLVHTGQHYDRQMSGVFFRDLDLPRPDVDLGVGSASHAVQTARVMEGMEGVLLERRPDLLLVVGDVNSTVASALAAVKLGVPVAHVEAGLRSFDREMPEEVNRVVTDSICDFLFASEASGAENLAREGTAPEKVRLVGNVMVDALLARLDRISRSTILAHWGLVPRAYAVLTLHRPENVEDPEVAGRIVAAVEELQRRLPIVFPAHPRTAARFREMGLWEALEEARDVQLAGPLGYLDFLRLVQCSACVLTDSGGLQEEATVLGVPCLTLRSSTERPATVLQGTNRLVGSRPRAIVGGALEALRGEWAAGGVPELWDGRAAERIVDVLLAERERIHDLYLRLRRRATCSQATESAA